jgi:hypothetical protein
MRFKIPEVDDPEQFRHILERLPLLSFPSTYKWPHTSP